MCCAIYRNESYWYFKFCIFSFWNLSLKIKCRVALTVDFFDPDFLAFPSVFFFSRQVCNKRLANWTAITDTLTLHGFTRNAKHGFNSWKWSHLAWNSSSSLTIYFSILPLCGLQMPLRETPGSPSDIGKMIECFWQCVSLKNCNFLLARKLA